MRPPVFYTLSNSKILLCRCVHVVHSQCLILLVLSIILRHRLFLRITCQEIQDRIRLHGSQAVDQPGQGQPSAVDRLSGPEPAVGDVAGTSLGDPQAYHLQGDAALGTFSGDPQGESRAGSPGWDL